MRDPDEQLAFPPLEQTLPSVRAVRRLKTYTLPAKAAAGTWTFTVTKAGVEHTRGFTVDIADCLPLQCEGQIDCPWGQVCNASKCATVRLTRCGSCWDVMDFTVFPGEAKQVTLPSGRYYVTFIKEIEKAGTLKFTLDRVVSPPP